MFILNTVTRRKTRELFTFSTFYKSTLICLSKSWLISAFFVESIISFNLLLLLKNVEKVCCIPRSKRTLYRPLSNVIDYYEIMEDVSKTAYNLGADARRPDFEFFDELVKRI